jgi:dipeptidyl aminopeptidase/acylaminoacyl peptidase
MFIEFDFHSDSNCMAIVQRLPDGSKNMVIYDLAAKNLIGEVDAYYLPQGPRFSPDGQRIAFFGGGELDIHDRSAQTTMNVEKTPGLDASFCEWSPDGQSLILNAMNHADKIPPNIYRIDVSKNEWFQVTDNEAVDRFPQWSPSGRFALFQRQYLDSPKPKKQLVIADLQTGDERNLPKNDQCNHQAGRFCWSDDSAFIIVKERYDDGTVILKVVRIEDLQEIWSIAPPDLLGPGGFIEEDYPVVRKLLSEGYEVICPIYRGQAGAGQEHLDANIGEMGRADVWDVIDCGLDWKQRTGGSRPLALIGYSYGGLLTLLALADPNSPSAAGVTLWAVTDLDHLGYYRSRAYPADPDQMEQEKERRSP